MFDFVRRFGAAEKQDHDRLWESNSSPKHRGVVRGDFKSMLQHSWWTRVWIIQEVVAGHRVVVQRGKYVVEWEMLQRLLVYKAVHKIFGTTAPIFAKYIQELV